MTDETLSVDTTPPPASFDAPVRGNPRSPAQIGRYRVLGLLGKGGMSVVYVGYDDQLRRRVAIKHMLRASGGARGRLLREAQALARLAHPNVISVYEVVEEDEQLFIVMELVDGQTLRTWLEERPRTREEVVHTLSQAGRGVAAAHAVGLIHRDLKPENVMVGDDGRVRVMDFGLARAIDERGIDLADETHTSGSPDLLSLPSTATGALLGTPGYMAPEQYLGCPVDARSDIFSFCVVLHEVLHGQRLFLGSDAELREATLRGRIEASPAAHVPAWLEAIVRRGLAVDPAARWPSMDEMLGALARDPIARRRRVVRGVVATALAAGMASGLSFGYLALDRMWQRERAEQQASERWTAIEATIARAEADGDRLAADAAFQGFVTDPAHHGTRAQPHAWQRRGDRLRDTSTAAAQAAYAEAYSLARDPDDAERTLRRMAEVFHETWNGPALARTLTLLRARGAAEPELADLAFDAATWQRDLPAALAAIDDGAAHADWRPTLEHLAEARRSNTSLCELAVLPEGQRARLAVRTPEIQEIVLLDAALTEVGRWRMDAQDLRLISGSNWAMAQSRGEAALYDLLDDVKEIWRGPSAGTISMGAAFDVSGDGAKDLVFGRVYPFFGFRALDLRDGPAARERSAHRGTDVGASAFESHARADLDGDGVEELAVALGPWEHFDLRLFHGGADGQLELLTRHRIGRIGALAVVRRGDKRLLAAATDDSCPMPELFREPPHTGATAGVHLFEWTDAELVEVDFVPLPRSGGLARFAIRPQRGVGDFDGDGREDLAFGLIPGAPGHTWSLLLRQTDRGFDPLYLADTDLWGVAELDGDPSAELLVSLKPSPTLDALGVRGQPVPDTRPPPVQSRPHPRGLVDPLLLERWAKAEDLAELGMHASAAASLQDVARQVDEPPVRLELLDRAAELLDSGGHHEQVLALDRQVREAPDLAARALARSARALVHLGRYDEALVDARALLRATGRTEEQDALGRSLADSLAPLVSSDRRLALRFDAPLSPAWRFITPGALRRDPTRGVLEVTLPATTEPVAELPIEWDGGPLSLEFEVEIERLEYGSCLRVALVDEDGEAWFGGGYCGNGGGGRLLHGGSLKNGFEGWTTEPQHVVPSGDHPRRVLVRLAYFPDRGIGERVLADGDVLKTSSIKLTGMRPGKHRLQIGAFAVQSEWSLAVGKFHHISVRGARIPEIAADAILREAPARLLAENRPRAALTALAGAIEPHPRADPIRLLASAALHDGAGVAEATQAVLSNLHDGSWRVDLVLALRSDPVAGVALRSAAGSAFLPVLRDAWLIMASHRNDPEYRRLVLEQLEGIESLTPVGLEETHALRRLLSRRARMWSLSGDPGRAREDLERAAELPRTGDPSDDDRSLQVEVLLELARLLARSEPAVAREHVAAALRLTASPEETRERIAAEPSLAPVLAAGLH